MKIGLIDTERFEVSMSYFPNIALGKIARWHKSQGDDVEFAMPGEHYDVLYNAKIFNFSPDVNLLWYSYDRIVKGGTGHDLHSKLPDHIDKLQPDYSIYTQDDGITAYGFLTRGCINKCPWCVVPEKEGGMKPYMDIDEIMVEGRTRAVLMDNNILASGEYGKQQMEKIASKGYRIDFNQAMDARLVTDEWADLIASCKWIDGRVRFACDTKAQISHCEKAIEMLRKRGFKGEVLLYALLGADNDIKECLSRLNHFREWKKVIMFAMPFRTLDRVNIVPQWQKDLAHWCNRRELYASTNFEDFEVRKGFKC